jgi:four helix bundle protein
VAEGNQDLRDRTKAFALRVIRVAEALPPGRTAEVIGRQLLRAATSVGANYRAARRARSTADFVSRLGTVEEEADESAYWLELLVESRLMKVAQLEPLMAECDEITAMIVASIVKSKRRRA